MGESNRNPGLPLFEKIVDILYVIKRIIEMEGKFRGFAKLVAHFLCKLVAYGLGIPVYVLKNLLSLSDGKIER